ncbi:MAG: TonB-dependent receptor [Prevotellaceae bacterium]|jgi:outer membrane receptor protein involved in Fe transport|nr:TonB-dependent receptor [Prevotellaceae bacterium]
MKKGYKLILTIAICLIFTENAKSQIQSDSVYMMEEVFVKSIRKETANLIELPTAVSIIGASNIRNKQAQSLKEITMSIPNVYIPDYGTKLTSSTYIRGIGSRMNTPAIGLYVDNIPYLDKSAFDFDFYEIKRIEVLRGSQGTLYGRNAIGGIVNIYTYSPLEYSGTNINISAANHEKYKTQLSHYAKIGENFGVSASANYNKDGGFFTNNYNGESADKLTSFGGRLHLAYKKNNFKADYSLSYEDSQQTGFAYSLYDKATHTTNPISYNDTNEYKRKLLSTGILLEYEGRGFVLNSTTAFQYFGDQMDLDQDFTPKSIFTIMQAQHQRSVSEEIIIKSHNDKKTSMFNYQWLFGAFGFYQKMNTQGPVTFKHDGIQSIIQPVFDNLYTSGAMPFRMTVKDDEIIVGGDFETPTKSGAIFHQSTFNNVLIKGLSLTAGIRLDYEQIKIDYFSSSKITIGVKMPGPAPEIIQEKYDTIAGGNSKNYVQLLPKISLKYSFSPTENIYALVSKGYKSGGYNNQMFSDLMQAKMASRNPTTDIDAVNQVISYKPEESWNYEVGGRGELIKGFLSGDFAAFFIRSTNQQIAQFAPQGLGRMMKNAGRSTSVGLEFSLRAKICQNLYFNTAYGYTHATFDTYNDTIKVNGVNQPVSYNDNFVPMTPRHTLMLALDFAKNITHTAQIRCNLQYYGYGKTYWTEANNAWRGYYGTFNGKITIAESHYELSIWSKNILNRKYHSFYFESMGNSFVHRAKQFQCGIDVNIRF